MTEYEVSIVNIFTAETPQDAVAQMVAWLDDNAAQGGYRVVSDDGSEFIDAGRLGLDKVSLLEEMQAHEARVHTDHHVTDQRKPDPRHNADDAYAVFMAMPVREWRDLFKSLVNGGVLEPAEKIGYDRAIDERGLS